MECSTFYYLNGFHNPYIFLFEMGFVVSNTKIKQSRTDDRWYILGLSQVDSVATVRLLSLFQSLYHIALAWNIMASLPVIQHKNHAEFTFSDVYWRKTVHDHQPHFQ